MPMDAAQTLGKYEIRGTLGKGAMGTVYDGWDPAIARRVAIKTVNLPVDPDPDTAEQIARFRREAQAAGRLTHPNIVAVYDYGETADVAYIVMEFVDGPSLKAPLDQHERFAMADIQRLMDDLLAGLQFSHDRGVVHRDIKPANIMLTSDGRVKIADFGIARLEMSSMTQAGTMLGTPSYMSPEQFMGQVADARTDVYSAGVVLYQLLTGERPFDGGLTALMHKVLNTEPPVPSQLAVTSPLGMDAVVRRAMAKRPDDRYPSAAAFAAAIRGALAAPPLPSSQDEPEATLVRVPQARPTPAPSRPVVPAQAARPPVPAATATSGRSRSPLLIGIGFVGVLALGAGGWFVFGRTPPASGPSQGSAAGSEPAAAVPTSPALQTPPVQSASSGAAPQGAPITSPLGASPPATSSPPGAPPPAAPSAASQLAASSPVVASSVASLPAASPPSTSSPRATSAAASSPAASSPDTSSSTASSPTVSSPPTAAPSTSPPAAAPLSASPSTASPPALVADATPSPQSVTTAPAVTQEATTDLHAVRARIARPLAQAPCALANGLVQDSGAVSIAGFVGSGDAASLRQQLTDAAGAAPLDWRVQQVDPVFCSALGTLHSIAAQAGAPLSGLSLTLAGGQSTLHDGQRIMPRVVMADFAGEMRVDYLGHDGSVAHLYPTLAEPAQHVVARPATRLAPGTHLSIGDAGPGKPIWEVGPPYGVDMIIAVASSAPLLTQSPSQNAADDAAPYLRDLADGIERVRRAGGQVSGTLLLVNTLPK